MRLKTLQSSVPRHSDIVPAVGWSNSDEMVSCGDDHLLLKWNLVNMEANPLGTMPQTLFPTSMSWFPRSIVKSGNDIFALATSDGKLHLITRSGKFEKSVDAHRGAVTCARWSPDGSGLLTCGEDGAVKMWSRAGMLRSVIAQNPAAVYAACFDNTSSNILYVCGDSCFIKALKAQTAPIKWKSHDALVTCADWSAGTDLIITGGEDCKFKVWDSFGRILFSSSPHDYPITSLAWSPDGSLFVVGAFNILRLCDKAGWSHSLEKLGTGSVFSLAWSPDGTQVVAGCSRGHVVHAQLVEKRVTHRNWEITQTKRSTVEVRDMSSEVGREKLETKNRVTKLTMAHDYLVVITTKQCYIFSPRNWNTPVITDLKDGSVSMVLQSEKLFLLSDGGSMHTYNYDGRSICEIKVPGVGAPFNEKTTALANDLVAVRDRSDPTKIHLLDPTSSKVEGEGVITHTQEVVEVCVSQSGTLADRIVAYRDQGANVYIALVNTFGAGPRAAKIGSLVEQLCFNDETNMLAGIADGKIMIWTNPSLVFSDRDLLDRAIMEKPVAGLGKFPHLLSFTGTRVILRRSDGSLVPCTISPFPAALLSYVNNSKWDQAIRLCRQIKNDALWATLAGMAANAKNLYAAEIAYGALDEGEKVQYLAEARLTSSKDVRAALLVLLTGKVSDADAMLERSGNIFRAIMLNISMFRFERALSLAVKHNMHVETVLGYRQRYLQQFNRQENNPKFLEQLSKVEVDWDHINEMIAADREKEK